MNATEPFAVDGVTRAENVTDCPSVTWLCEADNSREVVLRLIVRVTEFEVAELFDESPEYVAVILCTATLSVETENSATPFVSGTSLFRGVPPSKKVTVPGALAGVTMAVMVTVCPNWAGFGATVRKMALGGGPAKPTTWVNGLEVLEA